MNVLLLETSTPRAGVALAVGDAPPVTAELPFDRRHARDLLPAVRDLLAQAGVRPAALTHVVVDHGPGSYTGLRVGLMAAKALRFATGAVVGVVDAPRVLAEAAGDAVPVGGRLHVLIDAQQGHLYTATLRRGSAGWEEVEPLTVRTAEEFAGAVRAGDVLTGPAAERFRAAPPSGTVVLPPDRCLPTAAALRAAWAGLGRPVVADVDALEPLYLRPSAAEQRWPAPAPTAPRKSARLA